MGGTPKTLGPFKGGLNNAAGLGEYIEDEELFQLNNLEVDIDGSLANRPAIRRLRVATSSFHFQIIGTYKAVDGNTYLCATTPGGNAVVQMINSKTGAYAVSAGGASMDSVCAVQWKDRMYVISNNPVKNGGYFTYSAGNFTWVPVATMPTGESATIYRQRLFIAAGIGASTFSSRLYYSAVNDGANWPVAGTVDIDDGNGEKLTCIIGMANDILCFKEHSTYRYGFQSDPAQAELSKISGTIGVPNFACAATYDNNNIYLMHGDAVFELFNYTFTEISQKAKFTQKLDITLLPGETFGLTCFRNRLFVRFYSDVYVYNIKTQSWSTWSSTRKFSRLYVIPSADVGLDFAYAHPATTDDNGYLYFFQDDRITGVGGTGSSGEQFKCSLTTKTYDFDIPYQFKVQYYWAVDLATSGPTDFAAILPNAMLNNTWNYQKDTYTWDSAASQLTWDTGGDVTIYHDENAAVGRYRRKYIKLEKKIRFRQVYYTISTDAIANSVGDSSVRIYDIISFLEPKEHVSKRVS